MTCIGHEPRFGRVEFSARGTGDGRHIACRVHDKVAGRGGGWKQGACPCHALPTSRSSYRSSPSEKPTVFARRMPTSHPPLSLWIHRSGWTAACTRVLSTSVLRIMQGLFVSKGVSSVFVSLRLYTNVERRRTHVRSTASPSSGRKTGVDPTPTTVTAQAKPTNERRLSCGNLKFVSPRRRSLHGKRRSGKLHAPICLCVLGPPLEPESRTAHVGAKKMRRRRPRKRPGRTRKALAVTLAAAHAAGNSGPGVEALVCPWSSSRHGVGEPVRGTTTTGRLRRADPWSSEAYPAAGLMPRACRSRTYAQSGASWWAWGAVSGKKPPGVEG